MVRISYTGRGGRRGGIGTGFVVSRDGLIATNLHVIGEARPIEIEFSDGSRLPVKGIHAWDRRLDLAIVRVDADQLPPLKLGDSDLLKQGAEIVALGNPQGLDYSVVEGVVSALREAEDDSVGLLQLAIPVEPGNSGGPILDRTGRVHGIMTFKSAITDNLGFAMPVNLLKPLLQKPNPVPMERWLTIGALDPARWQPLMGARWSQWAGVISAREFGQGFGGRSLCISQQRVPELPLEITVEVRLDDESGAAGLAFASDEGDVHYGFYPSAGNLRLTRFGGPDVYSWEVLDEVSSQDYHAGEWNRLRVRVEEDRILCFVNGTQVIESQDKELRHGKAGLCKFRATEADFRKFAIGKNLQVSVDRKLIARLQESISDYSKGDPDSEKLLEALHDHSTTGRRLLLEKAQELERGVEEFHLLAEQLHWRDVLADLEAVFKEEEKNIDLFHAGLLIAKIDNPDLDVEAYREELDRLAQGLVTDIPAGTGRVRKLKLLNEYLFDENGFHGSRTDYYSRSNSYLNEVIDDREGLPITLSILYIELAKRIGLHEMVGVSIPGRFLVQYRPRKGRQPYIDVFDGGKELTWEEVAAIGKSYTGSNIDPGDVPPSTKKEIILRMLRNLIGIELGSEESANAIPYLNLYLALAPESPGERLNRALLLYQNSDHARAREDLRWLLDRKPAGMNLDRLEMLYERLEQ